MVVSRELALVAAFLIYGAIMAHVGYVLGRCDRPAARKEG